MAYSDVILATAGLVSYWRLGETSGNVLDSKGSNPGTVAGGITRAVTGLLVNDTDKAMQGDGVAGTYVTIPTAASLDFTTQATVELWVNPSSIPAGNFFVIDRGTDMPWFIRNIGGSDLRWDFWFYDANSVGTEIASSGATAAAGVGKRQHLVMTYDAAGTMKAYINGVSAGTQNRAPNTNLKSGGAIVLFDRTGPGTNGFAGTIDEVAVYNTALSAQQVLAHYYSGIAFPTAKSNVADGGTNGTAVTTANSGGASGDAFDLVTPLTGAPSQPIFANDQVAHGSLAYKIGPAPAANCYLEHQIQPASRLYGRMYFRANVVTPSGIFTPILRLWNGASLACGLTITSTGKLQWAATSSGSIPVGSASTNILPINTWVRIEWDVTFSATVAVLTARYFASMDATVPTETLTVSAQNSGNQAQADRVDYGVMANGFSAGQNFTCWLDSLNINPTAFPGPDIGFVDAPSGTLALSGSRTESFIPPTVYTDARSGTLALSGSRTESSSGPTRYTDAPTGAIALSGSLTDWETIATAVGWGTQVLELPPLRLHVEAVRLDGKRYRWGSDEPDPQNVPTGLRFSSTMPGGFESMDCVLPRKPGPVGETADLDRLSTLIVRGAGGAIAGEYRLERTPKTSGDQMAISPSAVGWQAHLDDNKGASIIYFDRELAGWGSPSRQRLLNLIAGSFNPLGGGSVVPDTTTGVPALDLGIDDPGGWAAANRPIVEPLYDAGPGNLISRIRGNWSTNGATNVADANWVLNFVLGSADTLAGSADASGDVFTGAQGASGSFEVIATAARRFAALQWYYGVASSTPGTNNRYGLNCSLLRVIGNHNLTIRGTTPATEGLYASDIVGHAVRTWAPLLVIKDDSIQQSNFIIPQMAFKDNTTASEIVRQSTRFNLADWGVFAGREFRWYERNTRGRRWRARIAPAQFEETGQQMDRLWESVIVQYNDVDGTARTVGPPGSFADIESASLKDIDPENPANKLGIIRRDKLVMGTSTAAAATEVGRRFLEEQKLLDRSGRARITGHVTDDHGVMHPYWRVLGGDLISFIDASDTSYRRIVKADHDAAARTASIDLDAPPEGLDALLERLGVVLAPLGL